MPLIFIYVLQLLKLREDISARDWIRPGKILREEGLRPKHPVVVVPGAVFKIVQLMLLRCETWPDCCKLAFEVQALSPLGWSSGTVISALRLSSGLSLSQVALDSNCYAQMFLLVFACLTLLL